MSKKEVLIQKLKSVIDEILKSNLKKNRLLKKHPNQTARLLDKIERLSCLA